MPPFTYLWMILFGAMVVFILVRIGMGIAEWSDNNQQPVATVPARVVKKKQTYYMTGGAPGMGGSSGSFYYATFELENGEQTKFQIRRKQFRQLAEGEAGTLTHQGTRFVGFERATE